ncbi:tail tape measure protein [Mycoplana rhizolycopersici]|uniref:Tail tape measure protein n=1 Tax=Mycoplana rhizolycopersici TaxID=2746702 RepID=A0ABX2Q9R1_9HYPH|nr:tail tape measure protein [Rhizobium rhizolycopersici]NVP54456.1 tail tape measure protein [Rhizobium rhizolycopersici]
MSRPEIPVFITAVTRNAEAALGRFTALARTSAGQVTAAFARIKTTALGLGALAIPLSVAGLVSSARQAASEVAAIGDEARRAGVSVKAFQEMKFVAEQNRVGVDAMVDGLKELSLRADEFIVTGGGAAAEAFQRLGLDAQTLKTKLEDPSALFTEIIGKLGHLDRAAQIRIADEVFGGSGGEKFVQLIEQGEAGIRAQIKAANDLGILMDEQLIERAAEVDRKFNIVASTVGTALKSAIVSAADSLAEFIDGFRDFQNQANSTLKNRQIEIDKRRLEIETEILEKQQAQREETEKLSSVARDLGFEDSKNTALAGVSGKVAALKDELRQLSEEGARITGVLNGRVTSMDRSAERTWTPPKSPPGGFGSSSKGKSAGKTAVDEYQQIIDKAREFIATQAVEQQALGLTSESAGKLRYEHELLAQALRAGIDLTPAQKDALAALAVEMSSAEQETIRLTRSQEELQDRLAEFNDVAADTTQGFVQDLLDGKKATEALQGALARLSDELLNSAFSSLFGTAGSGGESGGLLGKFFGRIFGLPGNAKGSDRWRGGLTWVGEEGPELLNVRPGAQIIPNHTLSALSKMDARDRSLPSSARGQAGGDGFNFSNVNNIDARGADEAAVVRLEKGLAKANAELEARVVKIVRARPQKGW